MALNARSHLYIHLLTLNLYNEAVDSLSLWDAFLTKFPEISIHYQLNILDNIKILEQKDQFFDGY